MNYLEFILLKQSVHQNVRVYFGEITLRLKDPLSPINKLWCQKWFGFEQKVAKISLHLILDILEVKFPSCYFTIEDVIIKLSLCKVGWLKQARVNKCENHTTLHEAETIMLFFTVYTAREIPKTILSS